MIHFSQCKHLSTLAGPAKGLGRWPYSLTLLCVALCCHSGAPTDSNYRPKRTALSEGMIEGFCILENLEARASAPHRGGGLPLHG